MSPLRTRTDFTVWESVIGRRVNRATATVLVRLRRREHLLDSFDADVEPIGHVRFVADRRGALIQRESGPHRRVKRPILERYRLGVDEDAIRQVVSENPREVFGFDV
jgi:hypothetical protein